MSIFDNYTSAYETVQDSPDIGFVDPTSFATSTEDQAKSARLEQAKADKLKRLQNVKQGADLDKNSYTLFEDGRLEGNKNKIWNDLSGQEYQSILEHGINNYGLTREADGTTRYANGEIYTGPTKHLYMFGTKDDTNEEVKFGVAKGDLAGAEGRYTPE